jgi:hypothetical protein
MYVTAVLVEKCWNVFPMYCSEEPEQPRDSPVQCMADFRGPGINTIGYKVAPMAKCSPTSPVANRQHVCSSTYHPTSVVLGPRPSSTPRIPPDLGHTRSSPQLDPSYPTRPQSYSALAPAQPLVPHPTSVVLGPRPRPTPHDMPSTSAHQMPPWQNTIRPPM